MFELDDKVALVIGGRGYLGRDFCYRLRSQNAEVISADLNTLSKAASAADYFCDADGILQLDIDVTKKDSVARVVDQVLRQYGRIDVLVYSVTAKPEDFYAAYTECSLEGWQSVIRAELDGAFLVTQQVGSVMEKQFCGSIILMSSIYGVVGNDQRIYEGANLNSVYSGCHTEKKQIYSHAVYSVVKGGLISFARFLAAYWGTFNIRVNCVSPGGVNHDGENITFVEKYSARVPMRRKAEVSEVSSAIIFLASDESKYITGHNLIVDGGWTAW